MPGKTQIFRGEHFPYPALEVRENPRYIGSGKRDETTALPEAPPLIDDLTGSPVPAEFVGFQHGMLKDTRPERGSWEPLYERFHPLPVAVEAADGTPFPVMTEPVGGDPHQ